MTNTQSHAKRELEILAKTVPDAIITPFNNEILALCEAFGSSGQSGSSAPFTAAAISQAVKRLMMKETLAPLAGEDSEWNNVTEMNNGKTMYQNNRDSRVFKDGKDSKAHFIDAIIFECSLGERFISGTGCVSYSGGTVGSTQQIKSFPFQPKTFYVGVIDHRWKDKEETTPDPNGDWWTHSIKDEKQLDEVFEYYDKPRTKEVMK